MDSQFEAVGREFRRPDDRIASCGDVTCEFLVDPIPRPTLAPIDVKYRPERDEVVFIDCQKPNSMAVLRAAQQMLRDKGVAVRQEIVVKSDASTAMPTEMLERLSSERGLLAIGVND